MRLDRGFHAFTSHPISGDRVLTCALNDESYVDEDIGSPFWGQSVAGFAAKRVTKMAAILLGTALKPRCLPDTCFESLSYL
ncbi:unnamed protein product [Medioppia subpectinata]|uniref:Uncharacterized protein n=1 Tax=Medioppia subpectinata TaxID=1979941 RepID=A0A7R9KZY7_9ACAR|nr:unnamed protein product [Medioppia subpectinata]CAG2113050.1 unnamed protein product [Medioppia subpectinata]